ncbi:unnamed protein product [Aspergillus oryzae RIB40]|uniref:DNA, SC102 n=1 Tax=Aspergillus oryzae (strain ATCC 42149 / RIB 40) TaxID=510516 RepID=Q2UAF9_ASPOR|nr:unnamed protein product [Aspergillus oryzae RIB40]BAE61456.1 unnamed protein product [Aspergillus oryzae RIB40]
MAAYSAQLRGASRVFVVDRVPERLAVAEKIGCTPIDFTKGDAVDQIIRLNGGEVDRSVDAVGYQAVDTSGSKEKPNIVLENMIRVTRACGGMGIPGLYVPRLDHAEVAYEKFDKREDGYTKVLIHPNGGFESTTVGQVTSKL